jgi:uncharacterized peroxidase-related enzyme
MSTNPISRYPIPDIVTLPEDIQALILEVQSKAGFVPNVFLALAHRPDELRAFFAYHDALMLRESGITKGEKEMIVVATSGANQCLYCVVAHGAILRIYERSRLLADQIATNFRKADITPRQKAMLTFALKICEASHTVEEADFEALRAHAMKMPGTLVPSPPSSRCLTAWRTSQPYGLTMSFTCLGAYRRLDKPCFYLSFKLYTHCSI